MSKLNTIVAGGFVGIFRSPVDEPEVRRLNADTFIVPDTPSQFLTFLIQSGVEYAGIKDDRRILGGERIGKPLTEIGKKLADALATIPPAFGVDSEGNQADRARIFQFVARWAAGEHTREQLRAFRKDVEEAYLTAKRATEELVESAKLEGAVVSINIRSLLESGGNFLPHKLRSQVEERFPAALLLVTGGLDREGRPSVRVNRINGCGADLSALCKQAGIELEDVRFRVWVSFPQHNLPAFAQEWKKLLKERAKRREPKAEGRSPKAGGNGTSLRPRQKSESRKLANGDPLSPMSRFASRLERSQAFERGRQGRAVRQVQRDAKARGEAEADPLILLAAKWGGRVENTNGGRTATA